MLQSHIIDINGNFVGAAVRLDSGFRFVALNIRVEELDGTIWPSLETVAAPGAPAIHRRAFHQPKTRT